MSFIEYLNSKRNFIIIWFSFHLTALFFNVFNIQGVIQEGDRNCLNCQQIAAIHAFTDDFEVDKMSNFWPFSLTSTYVYYNYMRHDESIFYKTKSNKERKIVNFKGIFSDYDYSEFLAYNFILLLILYFKWDK